MNNFDDIFKEYYLKLKVDLINNEIKYFIGSDLNDENMECVTHFSINEKNNIKWYPFLIYFKVFSFGNEENCTFDKNGEIWILNDEE